MAKISVKLRAAANNTQFIDQTARAISGFGLWWIEAFAQKPFVGTQQNRMQSIT